MSGNAKILVTGIPGFMTLKMIVPAFKVLFKKVYIKKFYIRELSDSSHNIDQNFRQMTVEFQYKAEAHRAQNFLNNKPFAHGTMKYPLVVHIVEESTDIENENNCKESKREPEMTSMRFQSPGHRRESSTPKEHSPRASREFDTYRDYKSHHRRHQHPYSVPKRSRGRERSSYSTYPQEWSRNSKHPRDHPRYLAEQSRYHSERSRYSQPQSRYPLSQPISSRSSPAPSRNLRRHSPAR